jgi:hypothetical protein
MSWVMTAKTTEPLGPLPVMPRTRVGIGAGAMALVRAHPNQPNISSIGHALTICPPYSWPRVSSRHSSASWIIPRIIPASIRGNRDRIVPSVPASPRSDADAGAMY